MIACTTYALLKTTQQLQFLSTFKGTWFRVWGYCEKLTLPFNLCQKRKREKERKNEEEEEVDIAYNILDKDWHDTYLISITINFAIHILISYYYMPLLSTLCLWHVLSGVWTCITWHPRQPHHVCSKLLQYTPNNLKFG